MIKMGFAVLRVSALSRNVPAGRAVTKGSGWVASRKGMPAVDVLTKSFESEQLEAAPLKVACDTEGFEYESAVVTLRAYDRCGTLDRLTFYRGGDPGYCEGLAAVDVFGLHRRI